MRLNELTPLGAKRQLVELMFSALPSIVLIVCGHTIAGLAAWHLSGEQALLIITLVGTVSGVVRVVICLAFQRRDAEQDSIESLRLWVLRYGLGGVVYSMALGALGGYAIINAVADAVLLSITVAMCYTVGMIIRVAVVPKVARLQLLALLIPLCLASVVGGGMTYSILAVLLLMFIVGGLQLINHMHGTIARRLEAEQTLARMALRDHLTNLPNRTMFEMAGESLRAACLDRGEPLIVGALDLDGFKQINDVFGHAAGDHVLRVVAWRMQDVIPGHLLSRWGGDEFAIIFAHGTNLDDACALCARLVTSVRQVIPYEGEEVAVTASIGIAATRRPEVSMATLVRWADQELYRSKASGKNRVCVREDDEFPQLPAVA